MSHLRSPTLSHAFSSSSFSVRSRACSHAFYSSTYSPPAQLSITHLLTHLFSRPLFLRLITRLFTRVFYSSACSPPAHLSVTHLLTHLLILTPPLLLLPRGKGRRLNPRYELVSTVVVTSSRALLPLLLHFLLLSPKPASVSPSCSSVAGFLSWPTPRTLVSVSSTGSLDLLFALCGGMFELRYPATPGRQCGYPQTRPVRFSLLHLRHIVLTYPGDFVQ